MKDIDWSKAPEWANALISSDLGSQYYWVDQWGGLCGRFEEWEGNRCQYLDEYHQILSHIDMVQPHNWILMAKRQAGWNGKGLPPIGTVCEVDIEGWTECEIIAHFQQRCGMVAAFTVHIIDGAKMLDAYGEKYFRPIKTQEQIAAEEREKSIKKMLEDIGCDEPTTSTFIILGALYDANYRLTKTEE